MYTAQGASGRAVQRGDGPPAQERAPQGVCVCACVRVCVCVWVCVCV
jgi:hypothetical protein